MKSVKRLVSCLIAVSMVIALTACGNAEEEGAGSSEYRVAMITDAGDITDQSFNQTTYEACSEYCSEHDIDFTYKKPDGDTDYARIAMIDVAVAEGYNIIVMPGYIFAPALVETTYKYPDVKFIALDMTAGDIIAAAVGNKYYENPDAYEASDYYNTGNTYCAVYREELPGYMAGYAAVKLGYRKLGYLGGQAVPAVMRFGFGYLQGIDEAAKELGASKVGGKMIGVDSDQSALIDVYGEGMTVTSAMKGLGATVKALLDSIITLGTWEEHVGKIENLGLVSGTETEENYVGLPEDTTQWNNDFTVEDYRELVKKLFDEEIMVDSSIDAMPEVSVEVNVREGTIM